MNLAHHYICIVERGRKKFFTDALTCRRAFYKPGEDRKGNQLQMSGPCESQEFSEGFYSCASLVFPKRQKQEY